MCLDFKYVESLIEPKTDEDVNGGVYFRKNISTKTIDNNVFYCYDECFLSSDEYQKSSIYVNREQNKTLQNKINELELKRVRALAEPGVKDESTGQTYLEYYTEQIVELRKQLIVLDL